MLKIRKATLDDIGLINSLAREAFPATYKNILSPSQIEYMMEWMYSPRSLESQINGTHTYFLAYKEGKACGYVSVENEGNGRFHLQKIYVLPGYQGKGIGVSLFETAEKFAKENHPAPRTMRLNVNRNNSAIGFYKKMGMYKVDEGDFDIGNGFFMNDYIMEIKL